MLQSKLLQHEQRREKEWEASKNERTRQIQEDMNNTNRDTLQRHETIRQQTLAQSKNDNLFTNRSKSTVSPWASKQRPFE